MIAVHRPGEEGYVKKKQIKKQLKELKKRVNQVYDRLGGIQMFLETLGPGSHAVVVMDDEGVDRVVGGFLSERDADRWVTDQREDGSDMVYKVVALHIIGAPAPVTALQPA